MLNQEDLDGGNKSSNRQIETSQSLGHNIVIDLSKVQKYKYSVDMSLSPRKSANPLSSGRPQILSHNNNYVQGQASSARNIWPSDNQTDYCFNNGQKASYATG